MSFFFKGHLKRELEPPPIAKESGSSELVRVWAAGHPNGAVQVVLDKHWDEPALWGILLADLLGHVANMYGGKDLLAIQEVRKRVLAMFWAEIRDPTDFPTEMDLQDWRS